MNLMAYWLQGEIYTQTPYSPPITKGYSLGIARVTLFFGGHHKLAVLSSPAQYISPKALRNLCDSGLLGLPLIMPFRKS
jgi:hypothetical protein